MQNPDFDPHLEVVSHFFSSVALLKSSAIKKTYSHKGEDVIRKNIELLDTVVSDPSTTMRLVDIPAGWRTITDGDRPYENRHFALIDDEKARKFTREILDPVYRPEDNDIHSARHDLEFIVVMVSTQN
jgi:hypothetical protein